MVFLNPINHAYPQIHRPKVYHPVGERTGCSPIDEGSSISSRFHSDTQTQWAARRPFRPKRTMRAVELLPQFKRYALAERGISPRTTTEIIATVHLVSKELANPTLRQMKTNAVREVLYKLKSERLWSPSTFINKRQYLKTFFQFCESYGYLDHNPIKKISKPKLPKRLPRFLSRQDVHKLLAYTDSINWRNQEEALRNRAIIRTFLFTGIRLSELLNLKQFQVNYEERQLFVSQGKGKKDRIIPIHQDLLPYLRAYTRGKKPSLYFFTSLRSECPLTTKNLYRIIKKIRKESRVYFSPHMLRHTMAKNCIESNINPFALQAILGHADISTTQVYVSMSQSSIRDQFDQFRI